ncbi:protein EPD1 [Podospora aff. communis PSN243]|uniref:1,3-beta-glucanosyltransferase n=1 Tax=Podospora aff. communis PSN243 TaxID=3040156 RepID=A0AAV9GFF1_9PEZI|nr:protein EPD1 [Podospora aff. communis PSN243]
MRFTQAAIASSLLLGQASAALPPIIMKGTKFFYENGTQFFMNGIAYQQDSAAAGQTTGSTKYLDPLADEAACRRDVPLLKQLRTNTIRTYAIDPTQDHSVCMKLLDDAGIYVISDLSEPVVSINRDDPLWDVDLLARYTGVVDELAKYSNVIGFFAGNEVTNNISNTDASAFVKAAVRDTKAHIKKNHQRWMGVGYASNDDADIRSEIAAYFNCGPQEDAIDYWGYNIYSWCGKSSFEKSGYKTQVDFFSNYSVPVFLAEYGCNVPNGASERIWEETTALYSDQMTGVFSGGIVYMYFQEENDYGIVKVQNNAAVTQKDFAPLATAMAKINPSSTAMDAYQPTNSPAACPGIAKNWKVKGDSLPPTPDKSLCDCMFSSIACGPVSDLTPREFGDIFKYICENDKKACAGISADPETGVYGAYSMCNAKQKLGYVLDAYYKNQGNAKDACDFRGKAALARSPTVPDSCKTALASASSINAIAATATSASGNGGTGSSSGGGKKENSAGSSRSLFTLGDLAIGLYAIMAMGAGAGVLLL